MLIPARTDASGDTGGAGAAAAAICTRADALERELALRLSPVRPPRDRVVLVGHGTGAYVAVELARRLERRGSGLVHAVVVAAQLPPRPPHGQGPDDGLSAHAESPDAAAGPAQAAEAYRFDTAEPLEAPLHVWAASDDPSAPAGEAMLAWARCTDGPTAFRVFEGSHDFLFAGNDAVAARLRLLASSRAEVLHA